MEHNKELGAFEGRYETDNRRRGRTAVAAILSGLVLAGCGALMCIATYQTTMTGDDVFPSVVLGGGIGLLIMGSWQAWRFLTRKGELLAIYEHGIVHDYSGRTHTITWDQIAEVVDRGKDTALSRFLGGNVNCRIQLHNGDRLVVATGFTEDAEHVAHLLAQAVKRSTGRHATGG